MIERAHAALLLGDAVLAVTLCETAIASISKIWGDDHLEVRNYLDDYATALFALGRGTEADAAIARARDITKKRGSTYRDLG
jgi:hypothetical protein